MAGKKTCPDCETEMTEGFETVGPLGPNFWHPGKPKHKYDPHVAEELDPSTTIEISVFRCSSCGLLKQYALRV